MFSDSLATEPPAGVSKRAARHLAIIDYLVKNGSVSVEQLARVLDVSIVTVYRDIADLEAEKLVERHRGEVSAASSSLSESSSRLRSNREPVAKAALARAAATFVEPGNSVFLDDSTTGLFLLPELETKTPLTLLSNALFITLAARELDGFSLIPIGGEYLPWSEACFGPLATAMIDSLSVNISIMSATAVNRLHCYHPDAQVADFKRHVLTRAEKNILYADHTKFARTALYEVGPISDFDVVIVTDQTPADTVAQLRDQVGQVVVAS